MDQESDRNDNRLTEALNDLISRVDNTFKQLMLYPNESTYLVVNQLLERWFAFTNQVFQDPGQVIHAQVTYWEDFLLLCKDLQRRLSQQVAGLPQDAERNKAAILNFIDKFQFLLSQHLYVAIQIIFTHHGREDREKIEHFQAVVTKQLSSFSSEPRVLASVC